jgi:hypothetical protein
MAGLTYDSYTVRLCHGNGGLRSDPVAYCHPNRQVVEIRELTSEQKESLTAARRSDLT